MRQMIFCFTVVIFNGCRESPSSVAAQPADTAEIPDVPSPEDTPVVADTSSPEDATSDDLEPAVECGVLLPSTYNPGPYPRYDSASTTRPCLCWPDGDECNDPDPLTPPNHEPWYTDPTMACPAGEWCDAGSGDVFESEQSEVPLHGGSCRKPCFLDKDGVEMVEHSCPVGERCFEESVILTTGDPPKVKRFGICVPYVPRWDYSNCPDDHP